MKRVSFLIVLLCLSSIGFADNPEFNLTGSKAAMLYFGLSDKSADGEINLSGLHCTAPESNNVADFECYIYPHLTSDEIGNIFRRLDRPKVQAAYQTETKMISGLLFKEKVTWGFNGEEDTFEYSLFNQEPCKDVNTLEKANTCLTFFGKEFLDEGDTNVIAVDNQPATFEALKEVFSRSYYKNRDLVTEDFRKLMDEQHQWQLAGLAEADYVGMIWRAGEGFIDYVFLKQGNDLYPYVMPDIIHGEKLFGYYPVTLPMPIDEFIDHLTLGLKYIRGWNYNKLREYILRR